MWIKLNLCIRLRDVEQKGSLDILAFGSGTLKENIVYLHLIGSK